jgi:translation initiation factor 3 subunit L
MYQDTFEEDDLIAEVELVAQARYSQHNELDDGFDTEGKKRLGKYTSFHSETWFL